MQPLHSHQQTPFSIHHTETVGGTLVLISNYICLLRKVGKAYSQYGILKSKGNMRLETNKKHHKQQTYDKEPHFNMVSPPKDRICSNLALPHGHRSVAHRHPFHHARRNG